MASSDTDDDIIISSALLIASTLSQMRQVHVRKRKRNSWASKQTIDQSPVMYSKHFLRGRGEAATSQKIRVVYCEIRIIATTHVVLYCI